MMRRCNMLSALAWGWPVAAGLLLAVNPAAGEVRSGCEVFETAKYIPEDVDGDGFGRSCAIDGETMIVAATGADGVAVDTGAAYIYRRDGATWLLEQKLQAADGQEDDRFGLSVALHGDVAIVGAPEDDDNGEDSGSAYVFRFDGTTWQEEQKLLASDGQADDAFGFSVAVCGEMVAVGTPKAAESPTRSGAVYVYRFDGSAWGDEVKVTPAGVWYRDFGHAVTSDGERLVVGAPAMQPWNCTEAVYVFLHDGSEWVEEAKLEASDGQEGDWFGYSVSIDGDAILVGACWATGWTYETGAAYFYRFDGSTWNEEAKLFEPDGWHEDGFGWSVSLAGAVAVIGAPRSSSGHVALYRFDGSSWGDKPLATFFASDGLYHCYFGQAVSMDGDTLAAGAPYHPGAVYLLHDVNAVLDDCEQWVPPSCTGDEYDFIDLGTLGGLYATAAAINDHGQIVGYSQTEYLQWHAFLWDNEVMTPLPPLPGYVTAFATDINNSAQVVGYSAMDKYGQDPRATLWENGAPIDLGTLGGATSEALAINDNGQIVGWSSGGAESGAFLYENGEMTEIYFPGPGYIGAARSINDKGVIAGSYALPREPWECPRGDTFIYEQGMGSLLWEPTGEVVYAPSDISTAGVVVGYKKWGWYMECNGYDTSAWKWDLAAGQGEFLPPLPGYYCSIARAVNENGDIVGTAYPDSVAVLWRSDGTTVNLNDYVPPDCELFLYHAVDINERGQIVCYGSGAILVNPIVPGDVNGDLVVDIDDLFAVLAAWGPCDDCPEDLNDDGIVDIDDVFEVLANWT
ncbi:MAG: hypothetical protein JSV91_03795 [Phycisphaerales bacterium]|nr:MAG: hypothetical protein JSV91_03795 [Phycisphaerales bacterium]